MMQRSRLVPWGLVVGLLLVTATVIASLRSETKPRYLRSYCIVHVHVDYVQPDFLDQDIVVGLLVGMWRPYDREAAPSDALAVMHFRSLWDPVYDDPFIRLVYNRDCEKRFEMTQMFIDEFQRNYPGLAEFTIDRSRQKPGFRGGCFSGDAWIDGPDCREEAAGK